MAGSEVRYDTGVVEWTWTLTAGDPATHFDLLWGTSPGVYPNTKTYLAADPKTDFLYNVVPGLGQYYAKMRARNAAGNGSETAELPFVVIAGPVGFVASGGTFSQVGNAVTFNWRANWFRVTR